jgi:hypothetical protein
MGRIRNAQNILLEKPEEKNPLERPRFRRKGSMDVQESAYVDELKYLTSIMDVQRSNSGSTLAVSRLLVGLLSSSMLARIFAQNMPRNPFLKTPLTNIYNNTPTRLEEGR